MKTISNIWAIKSRFKVLQEFKIQTDSHGSKDE